MLAKEELLKVYSEAELPLIEVMAAMEVSGIKVNGDFLEDFGRQLKERISAAEEEIYALAGCSFNINSPQQLGNILFETLGLPFGKKTKRGYSTSAEVLEKIRDRHPIVEKVLVYRNLTKLNSTYVEGMKPLICADGKIRAHFQQTVTATGRISCTEPNLQNIPIRQELGRNLRKAFTADDEQHILIGADYSQIELRVLAHLSGDDDLIRAFNNGEDIHKATAARVLGSAVRSGDAAGEEPGQGCQLRRDLRHERLRSQRGAPHQPQGSGKIYRRLFHQTQKREEYMDRQIELCRERDIPRPYWAEKDRSTRSAPLRS